MNWWKTWKSQLKTKDWCANLLLYLIGVGLMPLGVVLTVNSHLGAGGYDALNFALGERMGINTSLAIYMTAFLAVILAAVIRKKNAADYNIYFLILSGVIHRYVESNIKECGGK